MRIKTIAFENWQCFAGKHALDLEAKPYAIVAHHVRNKERSNWLGKTSVLEAIYFALFGEHRHRYEDDWITHGEKQGGVTLVLEDGTSITRSRRRGSSTQLKLEGQGIATRDDAQAWIESILGLTKRDFVATSYFEQGQMARFVTQDAGERTKMVTGWFRLEPLQEAEALHKEALATLAWNATVFRQQLAATDDLERAELSGFESLDALMAARDDLKMKLDATRVDLTKLRAADEQARKAVIKQVHRENYEKVVAEGQKLKEEWEKLDADELQKARDKAHDKLKLVTGERIASARDVDQKRRLVTGSFDGTCPVALIQCPAKDRINSRQEQNQQLLDTAVASLEKMLPAERQANKEFTAADAQLQAFKRLESRLEDLRTQATELLEKLDDEEDTPTQRYEEMIHKLVARVQDSTAKLAVFERSIAAIEKARGERLRIAEELSKTESGMHVEREARLIFGKNGAQKRVAETSLKEIEQGANAMLAECAIDLSVAVQWSYEGKDLASACDECGHPFPKSARAKHCERCEAPRGQNQINRLEVVLSNQSGAAKDLAGAAFQLAASAWMRANRAARWSVALLDEPFGQLDPANRRSFSQHLATLLRSRYGFQQSFTVAHHSAVLDALPGRIEIEGDGKTSFIKMVV